MPQKTKRPLDAEAARLQDTLAAYRKKAAELDGRLGKGRTALDALERRRADRLLDAELGLPGAAETLADETRDWQRLRGEVADMAAMQSGWSSRIKAAEARLAEIDREVASVEFDAACRERYALGVQIDEHLAALAPLLRKLNENSGRSFNLSRRVGMPTHAAMWHSTAFGTLCWRFAGLFGFDLPRPIPGHDGPFVQIDTFARQGAPKKAAAS